MGIKMKSFHRISAQPYDRLLPPSSAQLSTQQHPAAALPCASKHFSSYIHTHPDEFL